MAISSCVCILYTLWIGAPRNSRIFVKRSNHNVVQQTVLHMNLTVDIKITNYNQ